MGKIRKSIRKSVRRPTRRSTRRPTRRPTRRSTRRPTRRSIKRSIKGSKRKYKSRRLKKGTKNNRRKYHKKGNKQLGGTKMLRLPVSFGGISDDNLMLVDETDLTVDHFTEFNTQISTNYTDSDGNSKVYMLFCFLDAWMFHPIIVVTGELDAEGLEIFSINGNNLSFQYTYPGLVTSVNADHVQSTITNMNINAFVYIGHFELPGSRTKWVKKLSNRSFHDDDYSLVNNCQTYCQKALEDLKKDINFKAAPWGEGGESMLNIDLEQGWHWLRWVGRGLYATGLASSRSDSFSGTLNEESQEKASGRTQEESLETPA